MKKTLIILCLIALASCNDNQKNFKTDSLINELESKLNGEYTDADIDKLGNFKFDMGSASAGRVSGKLSEVFISMEILPSRPGCADICPEMAIIHFKCPNNVKCVTDPADPKAYGYFNEGVITFENLEIAKDVYNLLNNIKKSMGESS